MYSTLQIPILGVVETMSYFEVEGKKYYLFGEGGGVKLANTYSIPLLGQIPLEEKVSESSDKGAPIVLQTGKAAAAYRDFFGNVAREVSILHATRSESLSSFSLKWRGA
jgi:ATP-binding protein involved in chromosome partitioning